MRTRAVLAGLLLAAAVVAGCGSDADKAPSAQRGTQLHDLRGIGQLRDAFNRGAGTPQLILILSPT